jgi:hypothetical protein
MRKKWTMACAVMVMMLAMSSGSIAEGRRHPEIHRALESLRSAKEHLEHASHDFQGHRVEAIRAIDEAIHQLEICMKYE